MLLDAAQQERYARHLILDGFGGEGQERLLAAAVQVRGQGSAASWCARYLASSGVGRLRVDVASWADELRALGPWLTVAAQEIPGIHFLEVEPVEGAGPVESAMSGARAAVEVVVKIARGTAA